MPASPKTTVIGLRERKKERTRVAIQEHALRLFRERGYDETTVEDIAAAADISPSTFFRYFPTKEDVVMYDVLDARLLATFRAQPARLSPIEAFRATLRDGIVGIPQELLDAQDERAAIAWTVPQLRSRILEEFAKGSDLLIRMLAERTGRRRDDTEVRTLAGAIVGVLLIEWTQGKHLHFRDYVRAIDRALEALADGVPLLSSRSSPGRRAAR